MPKGVKTKPVYKDGPRVRVVEGLKPYKNPNTGFEHDRVETRDFEGKPYVFCKVKHGDYEFDLIFGWLHESEPELAWGERVKVVTMTAAERAKLREHLRTAVRRTELNLHFW